MMTHIESIEPRRLMAGGLDQTFGTNGTVTLPGVTVGNAVVSIPGGLFVEASAGHGKDYVYKLTDAGQIDTTWGDHGRVATPYFGVATLVYDKRYKLLYAAGVTKRFTVARDDANGNTATLRIQRFNGATGAADAGYGEGGVASFTYGVSNRSTVHQIYIGRLLPLIKRGLAVAFEHNSFEASPDDYYGTTQHANDIILLKYTASGVRDAAFGRRGIGNVTSGYHNYRSGFLTDYQDFDEPAFRDLQARADGSFRVLTSRERGSSVHENDDAGIFEIESVSLVQSQVLTPTGRLDAAQQHVWQVGKSSPSDIVGINSGNYESVLVQAVGDDGALAVGSRAIKGSGTSSYATITEAIALSPVKRPIYTNLTALSDRFFESLRPFARGFYAVTGPYDQIWSTRLTTKFAVDLNYNGGQELITPLPTDYTAVVVDADARLLALHGNQISRISG